MNVTAPPILSCARHELDARPEAFGELRRSDDIAADGPALRERMRADGYLFLPGLLDSQQVLAARQYIVDRLAELEALDETRPRFEAVTRPGANTPGFMPDKLADHNAALQNILYDGAMIASYERLFGGPVRPFDYTWFRSVSGFGTGILPHCDIVYMGRGTFDLCTSWTPIGDTPVELGGLMILEGSHRHRDRLRRYLERDVDIYCTNYPDAAEIESGRKMWQDWSGELSKNPVTLREKLGGRWLTTDYHAGDVLVFGMATIHASLDNQTNRFRLSSDSRYQRAQDPIDERWVRRGSQPPVGHGPAGKRGRVC